MEIFKQLRLPTCPKTFFQHIKRAFNTEADSLAAAAFRTHLTKPSSTVAVLQTRSHLRQQDPQDTSHFPEWRPTVRFDESSSSNQPRSWDEEEDGLVVMLSDSESGSVLSETEWPIHPAIDEYEICSADEDESEFEQESN